MIEFDDFKKIELRVGKIETADLVEGSGKLLKLTVDIGTEKRQILAGIAKQYTPEQLVGRQIVIVANLAPRMFTLRQNSAQVVLESQGMLLAAHDENGEAVLLMPDKEVLPGSSVS